MDMPTSILVKQPQTKILLAVHEYGKRLFSFIRSRVKSDADAEDILQDVWYSLSYIIDTEPIEELSSWLYRVSRNKIIDKSRKKNTLSLEDLAFENDEGEVVFPEELIAAENQTETEFERKFFNESIIQALNELPEKQRQVFVWNEIDELTLQEIADKTGENIKTIISRKHYAVLQLRKKLQNLYNELK